MKKLLSVLMALSLLLCSMALGETIDYTGTWKMTGGIYLGERLPEAPDAPVFTLMADGSMTVISAGETIPGSWHVEEERLLLIVDGDPMYFTDMGDELISDVEPSSGVQFVLTRVEVKDYTGTWKMTGGIYQGERLPEAAGAPVFTLMADGGMTVISAGEAIPGSWHVEEERLLLIVDGDPMYFTDMGDELISEVEPSSGVQFVLTRVAE